MGWLANPTFFFFFGFLFLKSKICGGGILEKKKKKVKVVELPQFESLWGLSVTFKTFEVKVQMGR
jgi:hypothetical protein